MTVPAGESGARLVAGELIHRQAGQQLRIKATPNPLTVEPRALQHAADINWDWKLSLSELTRVIELFNYRSGTTRTG